MRRTLAAKAVFSGVGLHGGQPVRMSIEPAAPGSGIAFQRTDIAGADALIPAIYDLVSDTTLCTRLTNAAGVSVGTVEHIMAALWGCGVSDALIRLDGPEVPIMDGSSILFVDAFLDAGFVDVDQPLHVIRMLREVAVEEGGRRASLAPAPAFEIDFRISFADPVIGDQAYRLTLANGAFVSELSDCRTFGHLHEVEHLRKLGLARGGGLHNAIVVDDGRVLNPEGLRRPDEFVRHKMLDAVGDLALAGAPILGTYRGEKAGHGITNQLLHAVFAAPDAWTWDIARHVPRLGDGLPSRLARHVPVKLAV